MSTGLQAEPPADYFVECRFVPTKGKFADPKDSGGYTLTVMPATQAITRPNPAGRPQHLSAGRGGARKMPQTSSAQGNTQA